MNYNNKNKKNKNNKNNKNNKIIHKITLKILIKAFNNLKVMIKNNNISFLVMNNKNNNKKNSKIHRIMKLNSMKV